MNSGSSSAHPIDPALVVVLAGITAALHVGKLPPALPVLRDALSLTLVQAGFLLSLVQLAGMAFGLVLGLAADGFGLRRSMLCGLVLLGLASLAGGFARDGPTLLVLRGAEGMGLLLTAAPAPGLIRRLVSSSRLDSMLGLWSAFMPIGIAAALISTPWILRLVSWPVLWWLLATTTLSMALWLWLAVPPDGQREQPSGSRWAQRLRLTLTSPGPLLLAMTFPMYSGQWLGVIGFLPSIYVVAGIGGATAGALTALAAAVNIVGNVVAGRLLQRGVHPERLLYGGFIAMGIGAAMAFVPALDGGPASRYIAILAFSMCGGLVPGTLFALSVRLAPNAEAVSTTVGWMQQLSALGQFMVPPAIAWVASRAGNWQWTWVVACSCSTVGLLLATQIAAHLRRREPRAV